jgi:hypothetical protein
MSEKIPLQLSNEDGNVYAMLGRAKKAARKGQMPLEKWDEIFTEATSGDYDHAIQTLMKHFEVS